MARMVPFPMLPTESSAERRLYEGFLQQLDDAYVVYHSVDWVLAGRGGGQPEQGEADFVIAHPVDGVLAVEAKGGELRYEPDGDRWSQGGKSGWHDLREDPFHQARDEMQSLVRILEARPGWDEWRPSYGYAVALPDATYDRDAHPDAPAAHTIDRGDMDRLAERVREIMHAWRRDDRRFGARGMAELDHALGFRVEIRTPLKLAFDEEEKRILELTEEQSYLRSFVLHRRRAVVSGPPGSGKTVLAIGVAEHLASEGKRTLLTCVNRRLADHLRVSTKGVDGLTVEDFHGLAADAGPRFDAIVVDEAQDFQASWWPALLATHRRPDDGILYLFADESQDLRDRGGLPLEPDDVLPPLEHNLRNTEAIHGFVSVFFDADGHPGTAKGPRGRDVEVLAYTGDDELFRLVEVVLANLVVGEHVPADDIVVLTPPGRETSTLWTRRRFGRFELADELDPDRVLWSSVDDFDGLERSVVVLAELGDRHEEDVDRDVRVGASRATHHLIVLATEPVAAEIRRRAGRLVAAPAPHA